MVFIASTILLVWISSFCVASTRDKIRCERERSWCLGSTPCGEQKWASGTWAHKCSASIVTVTFRENEAHLFIPSISCNKAIWEHALFKSPEVYPCGDVQFCIHGSCLGQRHWLGHLKHIEDYLELSKGAAKTTENEERWLRQNTWSLDIKIQTGKIQQRNHY